MVYRNLVRTLGAALLAATVMVPLNSALAQSPGTMGPGMMGQTGPDQPPAGGYGPGSHYGYGRGYGGWGMGPGMMGGYGMGPGMMYGGYGGYGMGPGMMGGYGMGPGMMYGGGYGGWGMGPGMMGGRGYGGYGMGPGMMYGWGGQALKLSDKQREEWNKLQQETMNKNWALMGQMHDQMFKLQEQYAKDKPDPKAVGDAYSKLSDLRRQMIENHIRAQNQFESSLTKEQRETWQNMRRGMGMGWGWGAEE